MSHTTPSAQMKYSGSRDFAERALVAIAALAIWEAAVRLFNVPDYLIPPPSQVAYSFWLGTTTGLYLYHGMFTLGATLLGFLLGGFLGFVLGVLVAQIPVLNRLFYPYVVAFQTVPKVALAPLIVVWFGFGIWSKVVMSMLICFFPVVVNTIEGQHSAPAEQIMLLRSYKASRLEIFRIIQLPASLPFVFAGLDIGIVLSVIGTIVGEFVGTTAGLGYILLDFNQSFDISGVFACLVVLSLMGVGLHMVIRAIQKRVVFWHQPSTVIGV
jgi:NitT/TauT family transport system permease protein